MPTRNADKYLFNALKSIEIQTYHNYEVILVDYKSIDNTLSIFKNSRIKNKIIINCDKPGVPAALNSGFARVTGDIVCWLNADDLYEHDHVFDVVAMQDFEKFAMIFGNSSVINDEGEKILQNFSWKFKKIEYPFCTNLFTGSIFFSKRLIDEFNGFDNSLKAVFEYQIVEFTIFNYDYKFINIFFASLRHHNDTITHQFKSLIIEETDKFYNGHIKIRKNILKKYLYRLIGHAKSQNLFDVFIYKIKKFFK